MKNNANNIKVVLTQKKITKSENIPKIKEKGIRPVINVGNKILMG